ncbi:MAG: hypothetical protein CMJ48_12200 [Planctomycetaceae bacterium]|nr:hypothetical protein [Planctomycetaceae bacterium]
MTDYLPLAIAAVLLANGICMSLPPGKVSTRLSGAISCVLALVMLFYCLPLLRDWDQNRDWIRQVMFWMLAAVTIGSAIGTISMRSPVYCAIWFAMTLLATSGLFMLQGAQFLSVATVIVYAGAILVTFLFVLMLAQPEGQAFYDRISWGRRTSIVLSIVGGLLIFGLMLTFIPPTEDGVKFPETTVTQASFEQKLGEKTGDDADEGGHMKKLGRELFSRHLISVEIAGTLLLVALVGAIAIVIQSQEPRGSKRNRSSPATASSRAAGSSQEGASGDG